MFVGVCAKDRGAVFGTKRSAVQIRPPRFHDLRHTYTTLLIAQGENPKVIQSQLGHASIEAAFDRYGHLLPETRRQVGPRLDAQLFGAEELQPVVD